MYPCPHCGKPGISMIRKACLGPGLPARCRVCHRKVGVPYGKAFAAMTPVNLALLAALFAPVGAKLIVISVGLLISEAFYLTCVPLEPR
jgi:hypothetical protein